MLPLWCGNTIHSSRGIAAVFNTRTYFLLGCLDEGCCRLQPGSHPSSASPYRISPGYRLCCRLENDPAVVVLGQQQGFPGGVERLLRPRREWSVQRADGRIFFGGRQFVLRAPHLLRNTLQRLGAPYQAYLDIFLAELPYVRILFIRNMPDIIARQVS